MEKWKAYEKIKIHIRHIYQFSGGDQECTIFFSSETNRKYALHFNLVFDFRYAIENAFLGRSANCTGAETEQKGSIYVVENSDYIKYFENQCCETYPFLDGFRHYVLFDAIDTGIELLAKGDPVLIEPETEPKT